jgi:hypothetical protein
VVSVGTKYKEGEEEELVFSRGFSGALGRCMLRVSPVDIRTAKDGEGLGFLASRGARMRRTHLNALRHLQNPPQVCPSDVKCLALL